MEGLALLAFIYLNISSHKKISMLHNTYIMTGKLIMRLVVMINQYSVAPTILLFIKFVIFMTFPMYKSVVLLPSHYDYHRATYTVLFTRTFLMKKKSHNMRYIAL